MQASARPLSERGKGADAERSAMISLTLLPEISVLESSSILISLR